MRLNFVHVVVLGVSVTLLSVTAVDGLVLNVHGLVALHEQKYLLILLFDVVSEHVHLYFEFG